MFNFYFFETFFFVWVWASLIAQLIKNPPAMQETRVWSLGQEDPLEEGMATHSSILASEIPWTEESGGYCPWGCTELDMIQWLFSFWGLCKIIECRNQDLHFVSFIYVWCRPFLKFLLKFWQDYFCFMFWYFDHETCGIFPSGLSPEEGNNNPL